VVNPAISLMNEFPHRKVSNAKIGLYYDLSEKYINI